MFVPDQLHKAADLYEERNKLYGDNYKRFGLVMQDLFPQGLVVSKIDDFNRLGILVQMVAKLTRYTANWGSGGHADSLDDLTVYTQMLQEIDHENRCIRHRDYGFGEAVGNVAEPAAKDR